MASEGLLALPAGIALALGANIGTCVTALLAALGKPPEAVRASVVHISFNIAGVLIWLPFLSLLADIAIDISPTAAGLEGTAKLAAEVPRQIANANTLFNVINTLIFIGFTTWFARVAERLIPERAPSKEVIIEPQFLDEAALEAPSIALENARREIERAAVITLEMMDALRDALDKKDKEQLEEVARRDDEVDILEAAIMAYLGRLRQRSLTEDEGATQQALAAAMMNIEGVADVIETDMVGVVRAYLEGEYEASTKETQEMVQGLFQTVRHGVELIVQAVGQSDQRAARDVLLLKDEIRDFADRLFERHAGRLHIEDPKYLQRVRLMMEFIEQLRHMYTLTKRIAKTQLPLEVARQEA
jgi:phosphate:Na+ symporter